MVESGGGSLVVRLFGGELGAGCGGDGGPVGAVVGAGGEVCLGELGEVLRVGDLCGFLVVGVALLEVVDAGVVGAFEEVARPGEGCGRDEAGAGAAVEVQGALERVGEACGVEVCLPLGWGWAVVAVGVLLGGRVGCGGALDEEEGAAAPVLPLVVGHALGVRCHQNADGGLGEKQDPGDSVDGGQDGAAARPSGLVEESGEGLALQVGDPFHAVET
ncbi:hypothetical protein PL81_25645, partial [Streptomyces sp. RSD-27]